MAGVMGDEERELSKLITAIRCGSHEENSPISSNPSSNVITAQQLFAVLPRLEDVQSGTASLGGPSCDSRIRPVAPSDRGPVAPTEWADDADDSELQTALAMSASMP